MTCPSAWMPDGLKRRADDYYAWRDSLNRVCGRHCE